MAESSGPSSTPVTTSQQHNVFILHCGNDLLTHHSIYTQGVYFDITLTGGREVSFRCAEPSGGAALAKTKLFDCTLLKKTKCSVEQIRRIGSELAADFGAYSFLWNNCRRFARPLARSIVRWDKSRDELKYIQRQSLSLFSTSDVVTLTLRDLSEKSQSAEGRRSVVFSFKKSEQSGQV